MTSKHFTRVLDKTSGTYHYVLTTKKAAYQQGFYFVNNSMTRDGRYLWFYATVNPVYDTYSRNVGYVDFLLDEVVICYDVLFDDATPFVDPDTGTLYFTHGKNIYKREPGEDKKAEKLLSSRKRRIRYRIAQLDSPQSLRFDSVFALGRYRQLYRRAL